MEKILSPKAAPERPVSGGPQTATHPDALDYQDSLSPFPYKAYVQDRKSSDASISMQQQVYDQYMK